MEVLTYTPARGLEAPGLGEANSVWVVLRSHPDFPETLVPEFEDEWIPVDPTLDSEGAVEVYLAAFHPPCHTIFKDNPKGKVVDEHHEAFVIWVRPGPKPNRTHC